MRRLQLELTHSVNEAHGWLIVNSYLLWALNDQTCLFSLQMRNKRKQKELPIITFANMVVIPHLFVT